MNFYMHVYANVYIRMQTYTYVYIIYIWAHPSSEKSSKVVSEHSNVPPVHTSKQKISVQEYIFFPDWPVANLLKSHGFLRQPQG